MNGHCGITGSTYRPVERATYVRRMEPEPIDPLAAARGIFACILVSAFIFAGAVVGAVMGVKL
jgi:hypothetical protein